MDVQKLTDDPIVYSSTMNIDDAVRIACQQPTLTSALTWIAVWESERAIKQAKENPGWETCFEFCFKKVMEEYNKKPEAKAEQEEFIIEVTEVKHVKVQANCFLAALADVWLYENDPDNIIPHPTTREGQLTKKTAGLSHMDSRYNEEE